MQGSIRFSALLIAAFTLVACGDEPRSENDETKTAEVSAGENAGLTQSQAQGETAASPKNVYFGDTHLHTKLSLDAFLMQNRSVDPDAAYRFAKGLPVVHPYHQARVRLQQPLDFLAVTDHAEYLGVFPKIGEGDPVATNSFFGKLLKADIDEGREFAAFGKVLASVGTLKQGDDLNTIISSVWGDLIDAAERHNDPGTFTTFLGWEWSSINDGANLHRVVLMKDGRDKAEQLLPLGFAESGPDPRSLWDWLEEKTETTGATFIAIPHNSNMSRGRMFSRFDLKGNSITPEYAKLSARWEPLVEVTQVKGDSEAHPNFSPTDEFANFEIYENPLTSNKKDGEPKEGDYVRNALMLGLELEGELGVNPYKFGMIGSTDAHTGLSNAEEENFTGKYPTDSTPATKDLGVIPGAGDEGGSTGWDIGAAGLAAVWAEENTRAAIFSAFQRRETYATTGPRIKVRFFGGWDFDRRDLESQAMAEIGYKKGVSMGGDLIGGGGKAPSFLVVALKDAAGANLDRMQIIKGWVDGSGKAQEKIFDIAWSGDRSVGIDGKLPAVGSTVDLATLRYTNSIGAAELATHWKDPEFNPSQRAFYYVRVLEIPTLRHTSFDAAALGRSLEAVGKPATIQERAYTSPIWYTP